MATYKGVLVCVTQQKTCERLIKKAYEKCNDKSNLYVLHVVKNDWNFLDNIHQNEALEYLFSISKTYNAEMTVLRSENIPQTITDYVFSNNIDLVVLGETLEPTGDNKFYRQLTKLLKNRDVEIYLVPRRH